MDLTDTQINAIIGFVLLVGPLLPALCCCMCALSDQKRRREQREQGSVSRLRPPRLPRATTAQVQRPVPVPVTRSAAKPSCFSYGLVSGKFCVICQKEFMEEDKCQMLAECNHMYHHECIKQWRAKGANCPLCRVPIDGSI